MRRLPSPEARPIPAPFLSRTFQNGLVGQRSEGGCEQSPRGGLQNTGIAVIQTAVQDDSRPAPGLPPVGRAHELHLTKGADMIFAPSRPGQQQVSLLRARQGRPPMITIWGLTDGAKLVHPNDRRRRPQPKGRHGRQGMHESGSPSHPPTCREKATPGSRQALGWMHVLHAASACNGIKKETFLRGGSAPPWGPQCGFWSPTIC